MVVGVLKRPNGLVGCLGDDGHLVRGRAGGRAGVRVRVRGRVRVTVRVRVRVRIGVRGRARVGLGDDGHLVRRLALRDREPGVADGQYHGVEDRVAKHLR